MVGQERGSVEIHISWNSVVVLLDALRFSDSIFKLSCLV
jgi:hypothetical protein